MLKPSVLAGRCRLSRELHFLPWEKAIGRGVCPAASHLAAHAASKQAARAATSGAANRAWGPGMQVPKGRLPGRAHFYTPKIKLPEEGVVHFCEAEEPPPYKGAAPDTRPSLGPSRLLGCAGHKRKSLWTTRGGCACSARLRL